MNRVRSVVALTVRAFGGVRAALPILAVTATLGAFAVIPSASAQAPAAPMPSDTCTATLTLDPLIIAIGGDQSVGLLLSGFEPGAHYSIFVGSRHFGRGIIGSDGTAGMPIFVDAVTAAAPTVQATTGGRCAVATLIIAGPLRVSCEPVIVNGVLIACPLIRH